MQMKLTEILLNCQIPCFGAIAEGLAEVPRESISRRGKLIIRRRLTPGKERTFKNYTNDYINRLRILTGKSTKPPASAPRVSAEPLKAGDIVRVRSRDEIEDMLDHWRQVRGCTFMPEMAEYCGTVQSVFKSMKRFVDERDLKIKKSPGIILLEGVMCKGTAEFGSCDRSCLHFWREEWLEKLDAGLVLQPSVSSASQVQDDFMRVRPLEEIEATLDRDRRHRGCTFLPEMAEYCGTTRHVLKTVNRFVDERDLKAKNASGIILLDGIMCKGTLEFGSCDRSCHLLWRKEWLERIH